MLRLTTFGGLTLLRGDVDLTGAATQRRRLAILAILAVARQRGVSRDRLLAYLWPESDMTRARHVLNQLLSAQRRLTGEQRLFVGGKTLRLNPALIGSDVAEFDDAIDAGRLELAVSLHAGPFLDGFFVSEAPEFERWVDEQRSRLTRRCLGALLALAGAAGTDERQALAWRRRAFELDPLDSETTFRLVDAMARCGHRAAALRLALAHEAALRRDLGIGPDERIRALASRLREATASDRDES